jgi:hypothetical protein
MIVFLVALLPLVSFRVNQMQAPQSTLQISDRSVVFFGPTQAERDSIIRAEGLDVAQVFDDFDYYAGKSASYLKGRGISVEFTTSQVVLVKIGDRTVRIYERKKMADVVGLILTDGVQEPQLLFGVATDAELVPQFNDFFRWK